VGHLLAFAIGLVCGGRLAAPQPAAPAPSTANALAAS